MHVEPPKLCGFLAIDKPAGITSARAVDRVKRLLPRGTKIGHAGTLDPFATGVLVMLIGKATRQCELVMGQRKQYEATIKLGAVTESFDPETPEVPFVPAVEDAGSPRPAVENITRSDVERAVGSFVGEIDQMPPVFSALKVQGRRAADRIRAGEMVELRPRRVVVYAAKLLRYEPPLARVVIDCGRGTYIRAIARDLGAALGVGGYLTQLRRTRVGDFEVAGACPLDGLSGEEIARRLNPVNPA